MIIAMESSKIRFSMGGKCCIFQARPCHDCSLCSLPYHQARAFIIAVLPTHLSFSQFSVRSFFTDFVQVPASLSLPSFLAG